MSSARVKNTFSGIGELDASVPPSSLVLKLSITYKSIRYFVQSLSHDQIIFFGNYTLHHVESAVELKQRLERISESDEVLQLAFAKVVVGLDAAYSLYPAGLSDQPAAGDYITLNQAIGGMGLDMAFNIETLLYDQFNTLFRNSKLVHLNSSLLSTLPALNDASSNKLFVNVDPSFFDLIRFTNNGELQLMNRYEYKTETDFVYFLLLCCTELNIDPGNTELILLGEVDKDSRVYNICNQYLRNVDMVQQPSGIHFSKAFDAYPRHLHFNLYNLGA